MMHHTRQTIIFILLLLPCAVVSLRPAHAAWQIEYDDEVARATGLSSNARGGNFATRGEAEAYHNSMPGWYRMHSRIVGFDALPAAPYPSEEDPELLHRQEEQQRLQLLQQQEDEHRLQLQKERDEVDKTEREKRDSEKVQQRRFNEGKSDLLKSINGGNAQELGLDTGADDGLRPAGTSFFGLGGGGPGPDKKPVSGHAPIAGLPDVKEETWLQMQKRMMEERKKIAAQNNKLRKELASYVPPLKGYERVHEGVILGLGTDTETARRMEADGVSCFTGKTYASINTAAEQARKEGKDIGGAMVVSFGTQKDKEAMSSYLASEAKRVGGDHFTGGEVSLDTPQGREAVARLSGKEFDRLIAHSNGASVTEALIKNDIIKVNELNVVGGDRSLLKGHDYQELIDSGKVKRVVVWINLNDPVPGLTSIDQLKLAERSKDAAQHLAKKITGDLAGGDSGVTYRYMWGADYRIKPEAEKNKLEATIAAHYLESSYYPGMANEMGVNYSIPKRVRDDK